MPVKEAGNLEERRLPGLPRSWAMFLAATLVLALCFSAPLFELVRFAVGSDLYSYVVLMPVVSLYLVWLEAGAAASRGRIGPKAAAAFWIAETWCWRAIGWPGRSEPPLTVEDHLAFTTLAFLLLVAATAAVFSGGRFCASAPSPFTLLVFMIPWPTFVRESIVGFLQYGSALAAHAHSLIGDRV